VKGSLSTKVAITVFALVAVGGSLTALLVYNSSSSALRTSINSSQTDQANQTIDKLDRFLYERTVDMQSLAGRQQIQDFLALPPLARSPATAATLVKQLGDFKSTSGSWSEFTLVDTAGNQPLPSSLQNLQDILGKQPSVLKLYADAAGGQPGYTDALLVAKGQEPVMLFMQPVHNELAAGRPIIGVLAGEVAWQANLDILRTFRGTEATLISSKGLFLGDNQPSSEKNILSLDYSASQIFKTAQKTNSGAGVFPGLDDKQNSYVVAYAKEDGYLDYHGNQWILALETPKAVAFAPASHLAETLIITFSGILIVSVFILLMFLRILVLKPISELGNATRRLSRGDFSLRTSIKSNDELGRLGQDFNNMADKIQLANSDLKNVAEESMNEKQVLATILDNLPVGVMVVEAPDGKPTMMNKVGSRIIGRGANEAANKTSYAKTYDILREDGLPYPEDELPLPITLRTGEVTFRDDLIFRRPDGTQVPVRAMDAPIRDTDGKITSAVSVFEDISKERELERSRNEFFSIASHELRTPLTAIMGNSSLIEQYYGDRLPDDDAREMVADIHESSLRLIDIVNDFLDTSRLEQKHMKYEMVNLDLVDLAKDVVKEYQVTGSRRKIHLETEAPSLPLPLARADKNRTKQVMINLVGNAMKFTESGSVSISFEQADGFIKILIKDTGRGMSIESQKLLFRKFEQTGAEILTRDSVRGTGLGLYISKLIVEQMGGSIRLESSKPGVGTVFSFSLPIASPEAPSS